MDINTNNISNEQIALIIAGLVAAIRKKYPVINGLELVTLATFIISLIACVGITVNSNNVHFDTLTIVRTLIKSVWITVQSVAGVSIASYLANKMNLSNNGNGGGNSGVLNASDKIDDNKGQ